MTRFKLLIICALMTCISTLKADDYALYYFEIVNSTKEYLMTVECKEGMKELHPGEQTLIPMGFLEEDGLKFFVGVDYNEFPGPQKHFLGVACFNLSSMGAINMISVNYKLAHDSIAHEISTDMVSSVLPGEHSYGTISFENGFISELAVPFKELNECKVTVTFSDKP